MQMSTLKENTLMEIEKRKRGIDSEVNKGKMKKKGSAQM
jgi:hypothetical protein